MVWKRSLFALMAGLVLSGTAAAGVLDGNCRMADQPAATLLIPISRSTWTPQAASPP